MTEEQEQIAAEIAQEKQQLAEQEKKYGGKIVVADFYQLGNRGKAFSKGMKEMILPKHKVEFSHVKKTNLNWRNGGRMYVINEKLSDQHQIDLKEDKQNKEEQEKMQLEGAKQMTNALGAIANMKKGTQQKKADKNKKNDDTAIELAIDEYMKNNPDEFATSEAAAAHYIQDVDFKIRIDELAETLK